MYIILASENDTVWQYLQNFNLIMDSFLLSILTQREWCKFYFFGDDTLLEHSDVYVDMNFCGAKVALKNGEM
jgi:hypothetical protein